MRKGLLGSFESKMGSEAQNEAPETEAKRDTSRPLVMTSPNMKKFSQELDNLTAHSVKDVDTSEIGNSALSDRFDILDGLDELIESIKQNGQKLPVLLRPLPSPKNGVLYEPIYGRRRIAAARALNIPVKAQVVEMSDTQALLAQGIENAARKDTSFIERAVFARDLLNSGLSFDEVSGALSIDRSVISRMGSITKDLPIQLIRAIGSAPGCGRRPWTDLRALFIAIPNPNVDAIIAHVAPVKTSDGRLLAALTHLKPKISTSKSETSNAQRSLGAFKVAATDRTLTIKATARANPKFLAFLAAKLDSIHDEWRADMTKEEGIED